MNIFAHEGVISKEQNLFFVFFDLMSRPTIRNFEKYHMQYKKIVKRFFWREKQILGDFLLFCPFLLLSSLKFDI